jgi:hypothetical protein
VTDTDDKARGDGQHSHRPERKDDSKECEHPTGEKCAACEASIFGATSFAEIDAARDARDDARNLAQVLDDFKAIMDGIQFSGMTPDQKAEAITVATAEMATRVTNPPEARKTFLERLKAVFVNEGAERLTEEKAEDLEPDGRRSDSRLRAQGIHRPRRRLRGVPGVVVVAHARDEGRQGRHARSFVGGLRNRGRCVRHWSRSGRREARPA